MILNSFEAKVPNTECINQPRRILFPWSKIQFTIQTKLTILSQ